MTAINTNTASLNAQYFLAKSNKEMESSMAKLSSGQKVNSAADDAAGLAIAGRMTSQIKGLNMAIKNANDSVALAQTAEGAMEEVTNMLQRMRELAVQASNGTLNDSDRKSLDAEVQALKTEIDRVSGTTMFNNQKLLDGSFSSTFQIGDKTGQTVDLSIKSIGTTGLGLGAGVGATSTTGARAALGVAIAEGDVKINGQAIGAITATDDIEAVLKAINDNVDNVVASAHNVVVAKVKGSGVVGDGQFDIKVQEYGVGTATDFNISAAGSMKELVANINRETGGVVAASINNEGKLVLSNDSGATITVDDSSATSSAAGYTGGTGFGGTTEEAFEGFITLKSTDGTAVTVERGNLSDTTPGTEAMMASLGFRETTSENANDNYTITGAALTDTTTAWGTNDLMINDVNIYNSSITTDTVQGRLDAINYFSNETGVVASAYYDLVLDYSTPAATATDRLMVNGVDTGAIGGTAALLASSINSATDVTGIKATVQGTNVHISLKRVNADIKLVAATTLADDAASTNEATLETAMKRFTRIRLDSTTDTPIRIQLSAAGATSVGEHGFLEANIGAADFDQNAATMSAVGQSSVRGLGISTASSASEALTTLDAAIDTVNAIRGDLGALQNRLDHTVNNLSSVTNATEGAKGRIMDTDFATETANLTKQQILSQAATSMLAQANQSKQGILALLQG